tara:strand:- start:482 stop:1549 length:1068 start_codon:yes stop_codon:yes gene_type:complete
MDSIVTGATSATDDLIKLPSATTSMIYFFCLTIIYGFIMIYTTISSETLSQVSINSSNPVFTITYMMLLISGTYFINANISKNMCKGNDIQWVSIFPATVIPWISIFGILYLMLELFPGWINPFSNTIGFFVVNALGATSSVRDILKSAEDNRDTTLKKALENIEKNYSRFINEIDSDKDNYIKFIKQLYLENFIAGNSSDNGKFNEFLNSSKSVNLFALINVKKLIGKLFWYVLAGTLVSAVSYNFIINMSCDKSVAQTEKDYSELYENSYEPIYGKIWQSLSEEPPENNNQDYSTQLAVFIQEHGSYLKSEYLAGKTEISLTRTMLFEISKLYDELPANSYIDIDGYYFKPIA